jgi:hypothetical protein
MGTNAESGDLEMKGLYIGNDNLACDLSLKVNFNMLFRSPENGCVSGS